jgi:hypothetical protein
MVPLRVVAGIVDPDDHGQVGILAGRREQHLAGAALEVHGGVIAGTELPGGFDDDVRAQLTAVDRGRVMRGQHHHPLAGHGDRIGPVLHRVAEPPVRGVEFQQMGQRPGVGEIV